ncbi:MAG TPA: hypothetical protein VFC77_09165, partial [Myxococcota bacterium]|nr:hypothetical protein [Myxococcota bacterium]
MARGAGLRLACALAALAGLAAWVRPASAFEAFDGRLQVHGFGEIQTRAIAEGYSEDLDLVQWYNVLSVEIETDILPDGWGPFDLLSSYVRLEGRYDCVWTRGCGTMRSADSFGNRANKLPKRIADARDDDFAGQIDTNDESDPPGMPRRNVDQRVTAFATFETITRPICATGQTPGASPDFCFNPNAPQSVANRPTQQDVRSRRGFPGFDTFAGLLGADAILGQNQFQFYQTGPTAADVVANPNDDPFEYVFESVRDFQWTFRDKR